MSLDNIKSILERECVFLSDKIYYALENELNTRSISQSKITSNHICFLIYNKNNEVLSYAFNIYFKTNSFPFSLHSEINAINKYYKKNLTKSILKGKKKLIIIKVSKSGVIGHSKPCLSCANFIYNNMNNINITDVLYSTSENKLESLKKDELLLDNFKLSSGSSRRNRSK
jgi:cytidine deaminase